MSPVFRRNFIFARLPIPCLNGLFSLSFMLRTSWSKFWSAQASCGRQADSNGEPIGSASSTCPGDSSSMICGSVIWPKKVIVLRLSSRPSSGFVRSLRTFVFSPGPLSSAANGEPPS